MNRFFKDMVEGIAVKPNQEVLNGLTRTPTKYIREYFDRCLESAIGSVNIDVVYNGCDSVRPKEEFERTVMKYGSKCNFEIARSDVYMVKVNTEYKGEAKAPKYMYLPFTNTFGDMYLSGTHYHLSMVLTDRVISVERNRLFARLLRDKNYYTRVHHPINISGVRTMVSVIWGNLYRNNKKSPTIEKTTKTKTGTVHYLLGKFGFDETFIKTIGYIPKVGKEEINHTTYPKEEWVICSSTGTRPKSFRGTAYIPSEIRLAIPRHIWNDKVAIVVGGFFYVVDNFPEHVELEDINEPNMWRILIGHIILTGNYSVDKLMKVVNKNFVSLDNYLDIIIKDSLEESGIKVEDFYDLLCYITVEGNQLIIDSDGGPRNVFDRYLDVLYYLMFPLTSSIFTTNFELTRLGNDSDDPTHNEVQKAINSKLVTRIVYQLTQGNLCMNVLDYCGDNKYPRITSILTLQESGDGVNRRTTKKCVVVNENKHLHASSMILGSILVLPKSSPDPNTRINAYAEIDPRNGSIIVTPKQQEVVDLLQDVLTGKNKLV